MAVAIPSSVRLLPMGETLRERMHPIVGDAERHQRIKRVALLRRAAPIAATHQRNSATAICLGLRARRELVEINRAEPELQDAIAEGVKALVSFGITEVGQASEDPVKSLPLVIDLPAGAGPAEMIASRQKRANGGRAPDLLAQRTNGLRARILAEHVDAGPPANGRVRRFQKLDDRRRMHPFHERSTYMDRLRSKPLITPNNEH